jgi:hypothetical protein
MPSMITAAFAETVVSVVAPTDADPPVLARMVPGAASNGPPVPPPTR